MQIGGLDFAGRTDASRALLELKGAYSAAVAQVSGLEGEQRAASDEAHARSEALANLHRSGDASDATVKAAEKALTAARSRAREAWPERIAGARAAAGDAAAVVQRFVVDNFDALAAELGQDAHEAAQRIDAALAELVEAYGERERERVSGRLTTLASAIGSPKPGLVASSRVEPAVRAAQCALAAGGEREPLMTRDPRPQEATA